MSTGARYLLQCFYTTSPAINWSMTIDSSQWTGAVPATGFHLTGLLF